jgi:hypothetical protein
MIASPIVKLALFIIMVIIFHLVILKSYDGAIESIVMIIALGYCLFLISKRKQWMCEKIEDQLTQQKIYTRILDSLPQSLAIMDRTDKDPLYCNQSCQEFINAHVYDSIPHISGIMTRIKNLKIKGNCSASMDDSMNQNNKSRGKSDSDSLIQTLKTMMNPKQKSNTPNNSEKKCFRISKTGPMLKYQKLFTSFLDKSEIGSKIERKEVQYDRIESKIDSMGGLCPTVVDIHMNEENHCDRIETKIDSVRGPWRTVGDIDIPPNEENQFYRWGQKIL